MRIAQGRVALKYAVVLLTIPGLAACSLLDDGSAATSAEQAKVALDAVPTQSQTPTADVTQEPTESPSPTASTTARKKTPKASTTTKPAPKKKTTTTTTKTTKPAATTTKTTTKAPKPTTTTTTKAPGGSGSTNSSAEAEVLRLVNVERKKVGCKAVKKDSTLAKVARAHSKDMAVNGYFSHNSQDGRTPFQRMSDAGYVYSTAAENIAAGQSTPAAVMDSWMNSAGHKANILNCALTELGVGLWKDSGSPYGIYWTQDFGTPR